MEPCQFIVEAAYLDAVVGREISRLCEGKEPEKIWEAISTFPPEGQASRLHLYLGEQAAYHWGLIIYSSEEVLLLREKSEAIESGRQTRINTAYIEEVRQLSRAVVEAPANGGNLEVIRNFPWDIGRFRTELHLELQNGIKVVLSQLKKAGETFCQVAFLDS